jgi:hypothetical protein
VARGNATTSLCKRTREGQSKRTMRGWYNERQFKNQLVR